MKSKIPMTPGVACAGLLLLGQSICSAAIPTVNTLAAIGQSNTVATLKGTVNPNSAATTTWFEWGTADFNYSQQTAPVALGSGSTALSVSNNLSGLMPGVIYHYRVTASNAVGVAHGKDVMFGSPAILLNGGAVLTNECHTFFNDPVTAACGLLDVAAGNGNGLVLKSDETVAEWGDNTFGQTNLPAGLNNVTAISMGGYHALALKSDSTVVAWGYGPYGATNVPAGLSNVMAIAAGGYHSLALKTNGTVVAWGAGTNNTGVSENYGQAMVPVGLNNVIAIAAGTFHSLAVKSDGTVVAWGVNDAGQTNVPPGLNNVMAVAAGNGFCAALRTNGTVVAWGNNFSGQTNVPAGATNVVAISAWGSHSIVLRGDGTSIGWGILAFGTSTNVPPALSNVLAVAAGGLPSDFNMALKTDGTLQAWGGVTGHATNVPPALTNLGLAVIGTVDTNTPGSYPLAYTSTNAVGGSGSGARTVVVVDTTPPVITILGNNPFTNLANVPFADPGATALDACGGSFSVSTNSTVNVAVPGTYTVTYASTDSYGNSTNQVRTVVVINQPSVTGFAWTVIGTNAANGSRTVQLTASVNPNGLLTTINFLYGLAVPYTATNGSVILPASFTASNVTVAVAGFSSGLTYHWKVAATNTAGSGSAADQTFYLSSPGVAGDLDGDGVVTAGELNSVYANYVTNSAWLVLTNVAGLGGTNVAFGLSNSPAGNYSVEYTTNMVDWIYLGPASPRYQFMDTNGSTGPLRYYRLRYP